MGDLGIFASLDPVAVDQACIDAVRQSPDHGKIHLIERIDSKSGPWNTPRKSAQASANTNS